MPRCPAFRRWREARNEEGEVRTDNHLRASQAVETGRRVNRAKDGPHLPTGMWNFEGTISLSLSLSLSSPAVQKERRG